MVSALKELPDKKQRERNASELIHTQEHPQVQRVPSDCAHRLSRCEEYTKVFNFL